MRPRTCLTLLLLLFAAGSLASRAGADPGLHAYLRRLRNDDGGYRASAAPGPSSLSAVVGALRGLRYSGGSAEERAATIRFVLRCRVSEGGFADAPGGQGDVRSTAMALMALAELRVARGEVQEGARAFLDARARALPEIYISAAACEAAGLTPARREEWIRAYRETRQGPGLYGKSPYETAGALITLLRLKADVPDAREAAEKIRAAQRPDGGFAPDLPGADPAASDLPATYRMMRALAMVKAPPDLEKLRAFVRSCRNADGGYGPAPGKASGASPSYMAAIVLHWADELD